MTSTRNCGAGIKKCNSHFVFATGERGVIEEEGTFYHQQRGSTLYKLSA